VITVSSTDLSSLRPLNIPEYFQTMAADHEKGASRHMDANGTPGQGVQQDGQSPIVPDLDESQRKSILWKMDRRIIPMVTVLYLLSFLDRG